MVAQREDEAIDAYGVAFQSVGISCAIVLLVMLQHALQYFVIRVLLPGEMGVAKLCDKLVPNGVFTDVKSFYDPAEIEAAGAKVWRL